MAIYHFSGQIISRKDGRSSVAAAAYRSCSKLHDERLGLSWDFSKKHDLVRSKILLPEGAPEWMKGRPALWNRIEQLEKRKDAQLAREFNISLPIEFTEEQNWALAKEFIQKEFVDKGMVADVCYHNGHKGKDEQPHIHVMLALREVKENDFGNKNRDWNDKDLFMHWRKEWANTLNYHLVKNGFDMRVDHRTLEAQGIDLIPQKKKGSVDRMAAFEEHQAILRENGERIIRDPGIILKALSRHQSTFTRQNIAKMINRYTADAEQFNKAFYKVLFHPELIKLNTEHLDQDKQVFTTLELLTLEKQLIDQAMELSKKESHPVSDWIKDSVSKNFTLSDDQLKAYRHILEGGDVRSLIGLAGTGKSYLLNAAREAWEKDHYQVIGMALSGNAAENLQDSSKIQSRTIASYLLAWKKGFDALTNKSIVVMDEAGMVDSAQFAKVISEVHKHHAKLVIIGDPEQLQPIGAGAPMRAISERMGFVELTEIRRQREDWQKEATFHFAKGETEKALAAYKEHHLIHGYSIIKQATDAMVSRYYQNSLERPHETQIMLAATRTDVNCLNHGVRELRKQRNELRNEQIIKVAKGKQAFAEGDRIYFTKNDYKKLNVRNGTLGTILNINKDKLMVKLDDRPGVKDRIIEFSLEDYKHIDHGYAATVHKAQSITVDKCYVLASQYFDRHSTYVAMSRHRESVELYHGNLFGLRNMSEAHKKDINLDYANHRGIEVPAEKFLNKELQLDKQLANNKFNAALYKILDSPDWANIRQTGSQDYDERINLMKSLRDNAIELINKPAHFKIQTKGLINLAEKLLKSNTQKALLEQQVPELAQNMKQNLPPLSKQLELNRHLGRQMEWDRF
ncbi:MAG: mobA [Gammaproteobacteria bacterium]|jgi:Ti-type conjugative transfer relaxase TraA|nr:mobA [Gammaproteobacteria bacterium]